ncbi:MAG TPA: undecaprenyldiphospho-muramoylpentapeptide beta-N-acetylglucosaminyltransferase, partial [Firmicutes bacterium]|nr:undecaprenyldiphospho-muramoylpentapeptide beta-N-acetylglucosaminyltransferase [Bacillota bacterium]
MRVIFVGGGTGGHLYPALAAAKYLKRKEPGAEIIFLGKEKGIEGPVLKREGFSFQAISAMRPPGGMSLKAVNFILATGKGFAQSASVMRRFAPDLVVGTGGYVSVPVILAACVLGIPALLHEQNVIPGRANRFLSSFARLTCLSFAASAGRFPKRARLKLTGNPRASEVAGISRAEGYKQFSLDPRRKTLLVTGGSQGAEKFNKIAGRAIKMLSGRIDIQVIYVTGERYYDMVKKELADISLPTGPRLHLYSYLDRMPYAMAAADLMITRGGATTLAEINALGIPAIIIPSPNVTENHQYLNAKELADHKAAVVFKEAELKAEALAATVASLIDNEGELKLMAAASRSMGFPDAAEKFYECMQENLSSP